MSDHADTLASLELLKLRAQLLSATTRITELERRQLLALRATEMASDMLVGIESGNAVEANAKGASYTAFASAVGSFIIASTRSPRRRRSSRPTRRRASRA
jgi:hypothetical protein